VEIAEFIEARPEVMIGKPCFQGTRIPVYLILEKLGAGETQAQILEAYPQLSEAHLKAALRYAAKLASDEVLLTEA
jgi:uncharacterized protein (DUF433 family)